MSFAGQTLRALYRRDLRENLSYTFGRFYGARQVYAAVRRIEQKVGFSNKTLNGPNGESVFEPFSRHEVVASVKETAVFHGLHLKPPVVEAIRQLAYTRECNHWDSEARFYYKDVKNGRLPDGSEAILADVLYDRKDEHIRAVAEDPQVLSVVGDLLGYKPIDAVARLLLSPASAATDADRRRVGQTIDYHFDSHSFNFIYASYYLTPTDRDSGAHAMIKRSHKAKPWPWLLGRATRGEAEVVARYGGENVLVIEGDAGTGFIQDASCYHKALAPRSRDRIMLQIRYS